MNQLIQAGAITAAIFSSIGFAAAPTPGTTHGDLTTKQQRMVSQGLAASPSQSAPADAQPQVGNKLPDSMSAQALPSNVIDLASRCKESAFREAAGPSPADRSRQQVG
jgi:hypothetical protein